METGTNNTKIYDCRIKITEGKGDLTRVWRDRIMVVASSFTEAESKLKDYIQETEGCEDAEITNIVFFDHKVLW